MFGKSRTSLQTGIILAIFSLAMGILACSTINPTPVIIVRTLTPTRPLPTATTTPPQLVDTTTPSPLAKATIIVRTSFLRSGPGQNYRSNGAAKAGDIFPVFGKDPTGEWYQVNWREPTWIAAALVKLDIDPALLPTVNPETGLPAGQPLETRSLLGPSVTATLTPLDTSTPVPSDTPQPSSTATNTPTPTPTSTPTPVVADGKLEAFNFSIYKSSNGSLIVFGEVGNRGDIPIKNLRITISIFDAGNNLLDTESNFVSTPWGHNLWSDGVLYGSQTAPFEVIFDNPGSWVNYTAKLEYEVAGPSDMASHYNNLVVKNDTGRIIQDFLYNYQVTGEVENTGAFPSGNVWLVATLYDKNGSIIGIEEGATDLSQLDPGQSAPFKIKIAAHGDVAYYRLLLDAITQ